MRRIAIALCGLALAGGVSACSFNPDLEGIGCGLDGLCPDGFVCQLDINVCVAAQGSGQACDFAADCDDGVACTVDDCVGGACSHSSCPDEDTGCRLGTEGSSCAAEFVDISGEGEEIITAVDDGSAVITLGSTFDFFGSSASQLVVSTNGYLAANLTDTGDFTPACPITDVAGRILVYHADLFADAVYHQTFTSCPRQNDAVGGLGCDIVQWDARLLSSGVSARMEAVLYHGTDDIAIIFAPDFIGQGAGSVGVVGDFGWVQLGCGGEPVAVASTAQCVFNASTCDITPALCNRMGHSVSQTIELGAGISCTETETQLRRANRWMRVFDLAKLGTGDFTVTGVEVGIDGAASGDGNPQSAVLTLYTSTTNPPTLASLSTITSTGFTIADSESQTIKTVPISAFVSGSSILVAEWSVPDGVAAGHSLFPGANRSGETDDTYFVAPECNFIEPTTWDAIGFPTESLILNVVGTGNGPLCSL